MIDRAFSILNIKNVDAGQRTLSGWATTPELDRQGDQIDQFGCTYRNPLPLLWMHDATQPVGHAEFSKATAGGIPFTATIAKIDEPGTLKDRCDLAWQSVHARLVSAVSVGFRPLDNAVEPIKGGGLKYLRTEIMELGLVSIPANSQCTITNIKAAAMAEMATMQMAALRTQPDDPILRNTNPVAVGVFAKIMRNLSETLNSHHNDLALRIKALEDSKFSYEGVYSEERIYRRGNFTTCSGSLFHANTTTTSRPGSSSDWTLCCKRGADGKDATR